MIYIVVVLIVLALLFIISFKVNAKIIDETYFYSEKTPPGLNCSVDPKIAKEGKEYLLEKKVVITGLLRNSESTIIYLKFIIERLRKIFKDYKVLIVENDSPDDTRKILLDWAKEDPRITILGCGVNADTCKLDLPPTITKNGNEKRIRKMVLLRNIYLDYIKDNLELFKEYEFLISMDMDIKGTIFSEGMFHTGYMFKNNTELDGLCANGIHLYNLGFGIFKAYHDPYAHKELDNSGKSFLQIDAFWTLSNLEKCKNNSIRKVKSCFNGFTIYRLKSLIDKRHVLKLEKDNTALCEHVTLNEQLKNMYINPYLIFTIISNR